MVRDAPDEKWDEMSRYEIVLARQVPEPEWYPAGLFGACISRSPKTDPKCGKQEKNRFGPKSPVSSVRNVPFPRTLASKILNIFWSL